MTKNKPQTGGFSLIEILLASLVMSIGLFTIAGLVSTGVGSSSRAQEDLTTVALADMIFGALQSADWNDIHPDHFFIPGYTPTNDISTLSGTYHCDTTGKTFTYQLNMVQPSTTIKEISLQISPQHTPSRVHRFYTEIYNWREDRS